MARNWVAYAKVTFAVVAWGASFIATKVALQEISPATVVWLRFGIGVFILGLAARWKNQLALLAQSFDVVIRFLF